eukprot:366461-Chlamydomonas_euryale.AAC.12
MGIFRPAGRQAGTSGILTQLSGRGGRICCAATEGVEVLASYKCPDEKRILDLAAERLHRTPNKSLLTLKLARLKRDNGLARMQFKTSAARSAVREAGSRPKLRLAVSNTASLGFRV